MMATTTIAEVPGFSGNTISVKWGADNIWVEPTPTDEDRPERTTIVFRGALVRFGLSFDANTLDLAPHSWLERWDTDQHRWCISSWRGESLMQDSTLALWCAIVVEIKNQLQDQLDKMEENGK